ncbi:MAG: CADG protein, partial [Magnetococcales bacterium]|nr:CADG protein [Magnetococcales bacterium]
MGRWWGRPFPVHALALEPRLLFDGGVVASLALAVESGESMVHDSDPTCEYRDENGGDELKSLMYLWACGREEPQSVVFIDAGVSDLETLVAGVPPGTRVEIIQGDENGVEHITQCLAGMKNLESVQIISHGEPGRVVLGNASLDLAGLAGSQTALAQWGASLKPGGDLLLYGCDVAAGAEGEVFVKELARVTGADVAASVDATGWHDLGGDWELEHRVGEVQAAWVLDSQATAEYSGLLANQVVTNNGNSGAGSLRQAVTDVGVGETITFDNAVSGQTITLSSTITINKNITIDGDINSDNKADVSLSGGGAGAFPVLTVSSSSTLKSLTLTSGTGNAGSGGDMYVSAGTVVIEDTSFTSGSASWGGGLYVTNANVTLTRCTVSSNTATATGGGIYAGTGATLSVINSTISGNRANTSGGGIYVASLATLVTINNSTLTANVADNDNNITGSGGGVYKAGSTINVGHTIIAGNFKGSAGVVTDDVDTVTSVAGNFTTQGYNLIGDGDFSGGFTHGVSGDKKGSGAAPLSPGLDALADNGGTTQTHALQSSSLAVNAGNSGYAGGLTTDQAGQTRQVGTIDIGSYELQNTAPSLGGFTSAQAVNDNAVVSPLSGVTITDTDNVTVTVTLDSIAKGSFTSASLVASGFTGPSGNVYSLASTTTAAAQAAVRALVFSPTANRVAPGSTETTTFTVAVNDGTTTTTDTTTTVVSTSINDSPSA